MNDTNKHGGLLGHKINPVYGVEDTASPNFATAPKAICSSFTQDHHVIAVLGAGVGFNDVLASCLSKHGVVSIDATRSTGVPDDADLVKFPGYFVSSEPSANAYALVALTSAVSDGWLTTKTKLGVFDFDCPETARTWKKTLAPYLASQRITPLVHYTASCPAGASDLGKAAQEVQSAELKMRASGVDTVAITDIPLVVFAEDAESQHYNPKYLASEGGAMYQPYLTSDQIKNIHSAGWEPTFDLDAQHLPPLTATQKACLAALTRGGLTGEVATEYTAYFSLCGGYELYEQAVAKANSLSAPLVRNGIEALGSSFQSPMLLGGRSMFSQSKHAAPAQFRSLTYSTGCSCFQYSGPVRQFPTTS